MNNDKVNFVKAQYKEQIIYDYKNNPLIEALPDLIEEDEVIDLLAEYPYFDKEERKLNKLYRCHLVQRIFQYFQPLSIHLDLYTRFSMVIRQGYLTRNPINIEYAISFNNGYEDILNNKINYKNELNFRSSASGFTIVGVSGMGKTTAINRILLKMPQVILHSKYKDKTLCMYQVTWIKLECPFDGSIKALCINFFENIDRLLKTNYLRKYGSGRLSANAMIPIMAQICRSINLGVLVIDEIQNLNSAKSGGAEKMLNYFLNLVNVIGLPVILIGTPNAIEIIQSQFRLARRNSAMGALYWDRLKNDMNWKLLLEGMWEYQWTNEYTKLTKELSDVLYEESQGIIDIAIKLYAMAQIKAISSTKTEKITTSLIRTIAKDNLKLIKPMLDALKTGNVNKIVKYEDISMEINAFIKNEMNNLQVKDKIEQIKKHRENQKMDIIKDVKIQVIEKLSILDVDLIKASKYINSILQNRQDDNVNNIVKEILRKLLIDEEKGPKKIIKARNEFNNDDIRKIVADGRKAKLSAHDALINAGIIKCNEIFERDVI